VLLALVLPLLVVPPLLLCRTCLLTATTRSIFAGAFTRVNVQISLAASHARALRASLGLDAN
jgi:hypothetical protein